MIASCGPAILGRNPNERPTKAWLIVPSRILLSADAPVIWKQTKFVGGRQLGS